MLYHVANFFSICYNRPMNKVDDIEEQRQANGLNSLSRTLDSFSRKILGSRGFVEVDILTEWDKIVGSELAQYSFPQKISFGKEKNNGTLYLAVPSGAYALELQQRSKFIIDRINTYFGYNAVSNIKIIQNAGMVPLQLPQEKKHKISVTQEQKDQITALTNEINNEDLKNILIKLGENIFSEKNTKTKEGKK